MTATRSFPDALLQRRTGASFAVQLRAWGSRLWQALQRMGQRRAAWELYALAGHHAKTAPRLARELNAAAGECLKASNSLERN